MPVAIHQPINIYRCFAGGPDDGRKFKDDEMPASSVSLNVIDQSLSTENKRFRQRRTKTARVILLMYRHAVSPIVSARTVCTTTTYLRVQEYNKPLLSQLQYINRKAKQSRQIRTKSIVSFHRSWCIARSGIATVSRLMWRPSVGLALLHRAGNTGYLENDHTND